MFYASLNHRQNMKPFLILVAMYGRNRFFKKFTTRSIDVVMDKGFLKLPSNEKERRVEQKEQNLNITSISNKCQIIY